jgi:hypothetical protein
MNKLKINYIKFILLLKIEMSFRINFSWGIFILLSFRY